MRFQSCQEIVFHYNVSVLTAFLFQWIPLKQTLLAPANWKTHLLNRILNIYILMLPMCLPRRQRQTWSSIKSIYTKMKNSSLNMPRMPSPANRDWLRSCQREEHMGPDMYAHKAMKINFQGVFILIMNYVWKDKQCEIHDLLKNSNEQSKKKRSYII